MKTIHSYIRNTACAAMIAAFGFGAVSCNDMLDTKPMGVFGPDQIGEDEAIDLLTAAYATLLTHYFGNNESFAGPINNWVIDLRSDDALKGGENIGMEGYMHQLECGQVNSDSDILNFKWRNDYYSISRCNTAIKALMAAGNLDATVKAGMIGEMKTLRAYYFFDLYRLFKKFPYIDETVDPNTAPAVDRKSVIGYIQQDLRDAYEAMPQTQEEVGRFNKYVAAALLARVDLYESEWAEAEKYADYVIKSGHYNLYPNFLDISKPELNNQYESIMAVQFSSANNPDQFNFSNCLNCTFSEDNLYGNGDDFYLASQDLANAFRTDVAGLPYLDGNAPAENVVDAAAYSGNVDPRIDFTLGRLGMPWRGYTYNEKWCRALDLYGQFSGKKPYPSPTSNYVTVGIVPWGASSLNYIIIRYADVMLMKAEALIEQGTDLEGARNLINEVRAKAARSVDADYTPVDINPNIASYAVGQYPASGWSQDYARKAVRHERRVELAMEGHRWFDLVRWGTAVETVNKYYEFEVAFQPYYAGAKLREEDIYFPVPLEQKQNAGGLYD